MAAGKEGGPGGDSSGAQSMETVGSLVTCVAMIGGVTEAQNTLRRRMPSQVTPLTPDPCPSPLPPSPSLSLLFCLSVFIASPLPLSTRLCLHLSLPHAACLSVCLLERDRHTHK